MIRLRCRRSTATGCCLMVVALCGWRASAQERSVSPRAELLRKWDIDKNGTIDDGEAEVARAKMRRERAQAQSTAGLDPLTGKPRAIADEAADVGEEDASPLELPTGDQPRAKPERKPSLPGTRTPDQRPPIPSPAAARRPADSAPSPGDAGARPPARSGDAAGSEPGAAPFRGLMTGGARAGGAARPGYGATGPKPDLNAGRLPAGLPGRRPAPASGGLLPNLRSRPAAPTPPPTTPRRTVDDYDVY